ncbi:ROK family protein [Candidatus Micrarchaeota archaeon]|nr:ROK family protein [Candidatus Micrarchaeota archaeon]
MKVGVDVGGTGLRAVVYDNQYREVKRFFEPWKESKKSKKIQKQLTDFIKKMHTHGSVGIGLLGSIKNNKINNAPNAPGLNEMNLAKYVFDNDVNMFAVGESKMGAGKPYRNSIYLTLGTGVGGAIVIDKKLYNGKGGAGEFGHMIIIKDGRKCPCGQKGCLEEYVSVRAVERLGKKYLRKNMTPLQISELALKGNKNAKKVFQETGEYFGIGLTNLSNIFDPEAIVIGGGLSGSLNLMEKGINKTFKPSMVVKPKLLKAKLKDPVCMGAALSL